MASVVVGSVMPAIVNEAKAPGFTGFSSNINGIFGCARQFRLVYAKCTVLAAEGAAKRLVAISPQDLLPAVAGYAFGFLVEKKDLPVHVMGNDSFFKIVQDRLQVILMADYIFK